MSLLFVLLLLSNTVSTITICLIAPFFPPIAMEKGLDSDMIGFILSANPIGGFFASLLLAKIMNEVCHFKKNECVE